MCTFYSVQRFRSGSSPLSRYESESLGVFEEPPAEEDEEPADLDKFEPRERIGRYLKWHLDRQMSIGMCTDAIRVNPSQSLLHRHLVAGLGRVPGCGDRAT